MRQVSPDYPRGIVRRPGGHESGCRGDLLQRGRRQHQPYDGLGRPSGSSPTCGRADAGCRRRLVEGEMCDPSGGVVRTATRGPAHATAAGGGGRSDDRGGNRRPVPGRSGAGVLPGEPFAETGLAIKDGSPFPFTAVIAYAEDALGYVPTDQAFAEGGYQNGIRSMVRRRPGQRAGPPERSVDPARRPACRVGVSMTHRPRRPVTASAPPRE